MTSSKDDVRCSSCSKGIPDDDCAEIYADIWLPGVPFRDFEMYFHTDCLPEIFRGEAEKALGND